MATETRAVISYDDMEPNLSSDEMLILQALDGSHKYASELRSKMIENDATRMYADDVASGRVELMGIKQPSYGAMATITDEASGSGGYASRIRPFPQKYDPNLAWSASGSGAEGGFIQAVLPFLPMLGGLIGPAISITRSIFSKKGKGIAVGGADGILEQFFARNKDRFMQMEQDLANARGKDFFAKAKQIVKQETKNIVPLIAQVTPKVASHVAELVAKKIIPTSLQAHAGAGRRVKGVHKQGGSLISSLAVTIAKWGASKLLKNSKIARSFASKIHSANNFLEQAEKGGSGVGGKLISAAPNDQYQPSMQYQPPQQQYQPPQYRPPPTQYQPPRSDQQYQPPSYNPPYNPPSIDDPYGPPRGSRIGIDQYQPDQYSDYNRGRNAYYPPPKEKSFFEKVKDRASGILNAVLPSALKIGENVATPLIQGVVDKFANPETINSMISGFSGAFGYGLSPAQGGIAPSAPRRAHGKGPRPPNARGVGANRYAIAPAPRAGSGPRPPNGRGGKKKAPGIARGALGIRSKSRGASYTVRVL